MTRALNLPVRRAQFKTADFLAWLVAGGAEVCTPTNPYEVVRYRAYYGGSSKALTHIVYAKETGLLNFQGASGEHYRGFLAGLNLVSAKPVQPGKPAPEPEAAPKASKSEKVRAKLLARDGADCWFCGKAMGSDVTIEHLIPKARGGTNGYVNYALAHSACNAAAADKPLAEKIALRASMRAELVS